MKPELISGSDNSEYLVHAKTEIVHILRAIAQKTELVTAYFNQGKDFVLTSILNVDADEVTLDCGANVLANKQIVGSAKIIFVTTQDRVRVQFAATHMEKITYNGRDAFRIKLPDILLKLQRREYYRLSTPVANPIRCVIPKPDNSRVEVNIVDISVGGLGVVCYDTSFSLEPGELYQGCRITLPDIGTVVTSLEICSVFEVTLKTGAVTMRSGCQFVDIPSSMQAMIQRYIITLDRERRAKLAG
jgi:c-di-GMP-binding flagellar brake protein YcgR